MQLFVLLVVLSGVMLGVGYLGNDIGLWTQDYGIGDGDIPSPITTSDLEIQITRFNLSPSGFNDLITGCEFTSNEALLEGTTLYCKLFQGPDVRTAPVIATGFIPIGVGGLPSNIPIVIPITDKTFFNSNDIDLIQTILVEIQNPTQ